MSKVLKEEVCSIDKIAPAIFKMTIKSEYVSHYAVPGQFVNVKCSEGINALLRRPISICNIDKDKRTFDICFQIKGIGTEYLSQKKPGDIVDIIGPLGNPFKISGEYKSIAVVGGGIGVFPLMYVLKMSGQAVKSTYLGFRNRDFVVLEDEFKKVSDSMNISTDDGSYGYKGLVIELLERDLIKGKFDIIYACGPMPMLKGVVKIAHGSGIKCQVSLEQRMGCGIGACLVCACKTKADSNEGWEYSHVCKDGPVFWSDDVVFE